MRLTGNDLSIIRTVERRHPAIQDVLAAVRADIPKTKREIELYQAAVLYSLTSQYDAPGAHILEIGTAMGYSAAVMSRAAPRAHIDTLNPKMREWKRTLDYLGHSNYPNVMPLPTCSWDYLAAYDGPMLDMMFVDGDHGQAARDFAWWEWVKTGGLMLFHDYAPEGTHRPCQPVYEALQAFRAGLGRGFDVLVTDDQGVGVAGWYRREDEPLPVLDVDALLWRHVKGEGWVKGTEA